MGLTVDLRPPDFELRMAILKNLSVIYDLYIKMMQWSIFVQIVSVISET